MGLILPEIRLCTGYGFSAYLIATEGLLGWEDLDADLREWWPQDCSWSSRASTSEALGLLKKVQTPILFIAVGCVLLTGWMGLPRMERTAVPHRPIDAAGEAGDEPLGLARRRGLTAHARVLAQYAGIAKVAAVAGEIKDPSRNATTRHPPVTGHRWRPVFARCLRPVPGPWRPPAFGIGVEGATVSTAPVHLFAVEVGGETVAFGIAVLAILTMSGGALTGLLAASASRSRWAVTRRFQPASRTCTLGSRHPMSPWCSPAWPWVHRCWLLDVNAVSKLASGFLMMVFIAVSICVIVLRRVEDIHDWYRPYTSPCSLGCRSSGSSRLASS